MDELLKKEFIKFDFQKRMRVPVAVGIMALFGVLLLNSNSPNVWKNALP